MQVDEGTTGLKLDVSLYDGFATNRFYYDQYLIDISAPLSMEPTVAPRVTAFPTSTPTANLLSIAEVIAQNFNLQLLEAYLGFAGFFEDIPRQGPYTFFAPQDAGFESLPIDLIEKLQDRSWTAHLQYLLRLHLVVGDYPVDTLGETQTFTTASNQDVLVARRAGTSRVRVDDILVLATYDASNGYAYMIDEVLVPDWMDKTLRDIAANSFPTMLSLVIQVELDELLVDSSESLTVFAPTETAFSALSPSVLNYFGTPPGQDELYDVLRYHFVPGGPFPYALLESGPLPTLQGQDIQLTIGDPLVIQGVFNFVTVVEADLLASNGVMHAIDSVLLLRQVP